MGKRVKPKEIVAKLRQIEALTAPGKSVAEAAHLSGVSEQTYYRWGADYGSIKMDQVKRLKELATENTRLRRAVSDLVLDRLIPDIGGSGKILGLSRRRACVEKVKAELGMSERQACEVLGQHRST